MAPTQFRIPGVTLVGPLSRHPVRGAVLGALTGAVFGALTLRINFAIGYTLAGIIAGALLGLALPWMRYRVAAGSVVAVAATPSLFALFKGRGEDVSIQEAAFLGLCVGIIYGALFWEYEPVRGASPRSSVSISTGSLTNAEGVGQPKRI